MLALLSLFAVYALHVFSFRNGTYGQIMEAVKAGQLPAAATSTAPVAAAAALAPQEQGGLVGRFMVNFAGMQESVPMSIPDATGLIPGLGKKHAENRLVTHFTGIGPVDRLLAGLIVFFDAVTNGRSPMTSLFGFHFSGSLIAMFMLMYLESVRSGNRHSWGLWMPSVVGMAAQLVGIGVVAPLWAVLHLMQSPLSTSPEQDHIRVHPMDVARAPEIPFLSSHLPSHQLALLLWQVWPVMVCMVQGLMVGTPATFRKFVPKKVEPKLLARRTRNGLRLTHFTAMLLASVSHLTMLSLIFINRFTPSVLSPNVTAHFKPESMILPCLPWTNARPATLGEGVYWFLQWDYFIAAVAMFVWALKEYVVAHKKKEVTVGWVGVAPRVLATIMTGGFVAAAVMLVWERDELLMEGMGEQGAAWSKAEGSKKRR
ncbi:hypothetical protein KEM55_002623 [Ascosphaera atra]|nr:hypothetical protein KEM55_002623 [Ascosphaera atra]